MLDGAADPADAWDDLAAHVGDPGLANGYFHGAEGREMVLAA